MAWNPGGRARGAGRTDLVMAAADGEELARGEAGMGSCQALPAAEAVGVNKKGPVWLGLSPCSILLTAFAANVRFKDPANAAWPWL